LILIVRVSVIALFSSTALSVATMAPAHAALDDAAAQALLKKHRCTTCHKVERTVVGPSFQDVAKKRRGQPSAVDDLKKVVRNGSTGTYGTASMPAFSADKISDADLTDVIQWILTR
jgi:cytochrome c